jgi:signal transduction histidine kinase
MTNPAHPAAAGCSPPAPTAVAASLARLRARAGRTALFMALLCASIALLLNAFDLRGLGIKLVYSYAIGISCWMLNEGTVLLQSAASDAWRRRRGQPVAPAGFESGWRGKIPAMVVCVLAGPFIGIEIGDALTGKVSPSLLRWDASNSRVTLIITVLASAVTMTVLSSMERLARARAQAEAAQRLASETQLRLLQSQLEPHMLFNTLANLRVLIGLDPARAQAMLDHLIAFLRATLQASRSGEHPLAQEFDRVADYLALMAVRMGPRLQVQLLLPEALRSLPVPPLLLQPLVENSIQHGLEPQIEGGLIEVSASRDGDTLVLSVRDSGVGMAAAARAAAADTLRPPGGFGLAGARERLATLYGTRASLVLQDAPDGAAGTLVTVRLPIVPVPSAAAVAGAGAPAAALSQGLPGPDPKVSRSTP